MSYKALYRTYRPNNFNEVIGQDHIVLTLKNIIANDKIGHAYLFAGPRGTGKTSVAHVFARAVNVNAAGQEVFGEMDILEIDAASNNGVAEVRTIIDNVNYAPTKGKYKVYIIDEVHMLTKGAFNALLKTLEEPPAHVLFILATTEPHKIPITILSRTQRFNFRRIDEAALSKQLVNVLDKEEIKYDDESIRFISKLAQGGLRDALSIADQASAFGNGVITFETISQVFGIISISNQINLVNLAYKGQTKDLMKLVYEMLDNGADIERLTSSLLDLFKDFIIYNKTGDINLITYLSESEINNLSIDINYAYDSVEIIINLLSSLRTSPVPRQSFELAILKIAKGKTNSQPVNIVTQEIPVQVEAPIEEEVNIFEDTVEIDLNVQNDESSEVKMEVVQEEQEIMDEMNNLENDILSTQEIEVGELDKVEDTSELDMMKLFETKSIPVAEKEETKASSVDEVLNLLIQANKNSLVSIKETIENITSKFTDGKYNQFVQLMKDVKVISAGEKFVLLSSTEKYIIDGVNAELNNQEFIRFTQELFGRLVKIMAITKDEFEIVKNNWVTLNGNGNLPSPKEIKLPEIKKQDKTKEEEYGENLFGSLFSS